MPQLVECVPNFSDGRNPAVYNAIADTIRSVSGVSVLDVSADPDHNRTVITFVGTPGSVEEAAYQAIIEAAKLINLDNHQGEHPRIGATDVCPFIPIQGVTRQECVEMAQRVGQRVGAYGIAVYLYGDAATRPDREKLADIRRGEYEQWKEQVATNPNRLPDFGPAEPKTWGATVIGVRPFLIAYNIYLNTPDATIAEKIARAIRFSNGGLRFVQARGFEVEGQAQVSMNLTDFEKTPIYRVQEMVQREAARYGCTITHAELIGLTPQKALMESARWYLQLDNLREEQVLEYRLADVAAAETAVANPEADMLPHAFLTATAAASPTPGGGAVAALAGALGAALTEMVSGLTIGRKKYADVQAEAIAAREDAIDLRTELTQAIRQDIAAFQAVMAAWSNKSVPAETYAAQLEEATVGAGEVPLQVARLGRDVARVAAMIARLGNINAVSDAAAGALMAQAAVGIAALNVKINGVSLQNRGLAAAWHQEVVALSQETEALVAETLAVAAERGGF